MGKEVRLPQVVDPLDYCSDTFRPVVKTLNPDITRTVIISRQSEHDGESVFTLASTLQELLKYHEVNKEIFDSRGKAYFVSSIAIDRLKTIIALKMLNIDNDHC